MQLRPQATNGGPQALTQAPAWQNGVAAPQTSPHAPQFCGSLSSERQTPLQSAVPTGHAHAPVTQLRPAPHPLPQRPQLNGSDSMYTQAPLQSACPAPEHSHAPKAHT
jgi:hypothetical protein